MKKFITTKEFGKVGFISSEESPVGFMLREHSNGVLLEEYFKQGNGTLNSVTLIDFENACLRCEADLRKCLEIARTHQPDLAETIFVEIYEALPTNESRAFFKRDPFEIEDYNEEYWKSFEKEINYIANQLRKN